MGPLPIDEPELATIEAAGGGMSSPPSLGGPDNVRPQNYNGNNMASLDGSISVFDVVAEASSGGRAVVGADNLPASEQQQGSMDSSHIISTYPGMIDNATAYQIDNSAVDPTTSELVIATRNNLEEDVMDVMREMYESYVDFPDMLTNDHNCDPFDGTPDPLLFSSSVTPPDERGSGGSLPTILLGSTADDGGSTTGISGNAGIDDVEGPSASPIVTSPYSLMPNPCDGDDTNINVPGDVGGTTTATFADSSNSSLLHVTTMDHVVEDAVGPLPSRQQQFPSLIFESPTLQRRKNLVLSDSGYFVTSIDGIPQQQQQQQQHQKQQRQEGFDEHHQEGAQQRNQRQVQGRKEVDDAPSSSS